MKKLFTLFLLFLAVSAMAKPQNAPKRTWKLAVLSDIHLMDPQLLVKDGTAFENYINGDRKLLKESPEILDSITARVLHEHPQVVFICGDLTKDGELASHKLLRQRYIAQLLRKGIKVFVVPGNHDINNPHAVIYNDDSTKRTATVSPSQFASIYKDCGYGAALARDTASLSYVAQITPTLRLLALDACRYEDNDYNKDLCVTSGRLKPATIDFIRRQVAQAKRDGCRVIAMMHHGVVPHFSLEGKVLSEYLVNDYEQVGQLLDSLGVRVIFTGHLHSQDAARSGNITDVETGSTVSYPHPYRIITVSDKEMNIHTNHLPQIASLAKQGISMTEKSKHFAVLSVEKMAAEYLPKGTPATAVKAIGDMLGQAYIIDLYGDEHPDAAFLQTKQRVVDAIGLMAPDKAQLVDAIATSLTTDVPPADNDLVIEY